MIPLAALAGCLHLDDASRPGAAGSHDDGPEGGEDPESSQEEEGRQEEGDGLQGARLNGTVLQTPVEAGGPGDATPAGNATVFLNATAESNGTALETATNEAGAYRFEDVAPGEYELQVRAACCRGANETVTLGAGENRTLDIELQAVDPAPEYVLVEEVWDGHIVCGFAAVNFCFLHPGNDNVHTFDVEQGLKSVVVAMEWDAGEMSLAFERPHGDGTHEYGRAEGGSALELRVDAGTGGEHDFENIEGSWDLQFRAFPQGTHLFLEEDFVVHYHLFYEDFAPDEYSALPE